MGRVSFNREEESDSGTSREREDDVDKIKRKEELKKIIEEAKTELDALNKISFYGLVKELPLDEITISELNGVRRLYESSASWNKSWKILQELAKHLWVTPKFGNGGLWLERRVKKIKDMTEEEQTLAVDFLNEIIPIWNKYSILANKEVEVKNPKYLGIKIVNVYEDDLAEVFSDLIKEK